MATKSIDIINVPSDIGSMYAGKSRAPAAFAAAGIQSQLRAAGFQVKEYNAFPSLPKPSTSPSLPAVGGWRASSKEPNGARNEAETVQACHKVKDTVTRALEACPKESKNVQFIISGECLYTPAILSAYWHHFNPSSNPAQGEKKVGIIYIDADTDLYTPTEHGATGTIAGMTLTHLTLRPGALNSMSAFSRHNGAGVVSNSNIVLFGTNVASCVGNPEHISYLFDNNYRVTTAKAVQRAPVKKAQEALQWMEERVDAIVVHLDVDVIDPGTFPLCNVPNWTGLEYEKCLEAVRVFLKSEKLAAVSVAEVNPDHDPGLAMTKRLVNDLVGALGNRSD